MRPRIPLAYAGLLIVALVAVVGFAAFSPTSSGEAAPSTVTTETATVDTSARVASAVLALRVSDAESRTATTQAAPTTTSAPDSTSSDATTSTSSTEATTTSEASTTTESPTTTSPPVATTAADTTPPSIKVSSPNDGSTMTDRIVEFKGTTEAGARVAAGPYEADVSDDGNWQIDLVLAPGANGAVFTATDKAGNETSVRVVVYYEPPTTTTQATTTTTKANTTTTTSGSSGSQWSPNWPADGGGQRNVENWRGTVEQYWPAHRVDCVLGIIYRESKGNPRAYNSSSSAEGLMQHLSKYWHSRAVGAGFVDGNGLVATPYNGAANIAAGAYLANWAENYQTAWWWPWKSSGGVFTAQYGSCTASNPG